VENKHEKLKLYQKLWYEPGIVPLAVVQIRVLLR
jgi:hypothetical protein